MKKVFTIIIIVLICMDIAAQNVGIGTSTPIARLHVADSNVLFTGPVTIPGTTTYYPPASGAGSRMMWYPQKAAFRAGVVDGTQWDKDSIGRFSFSSGVNTRATGQNSFATGEGTIARGSGSTSMGYNTNASGVISTSMGIGTNASGEYSTSMGFFTNANGFYSTSIGKNTNANGGSSTSMGESTNANGVASTSMGYGTTANGHFSSAMGFFTKAKSANSLVIGRYNDSSNTNRLFEIGNGTDDNLRTNAMTVLNNGNTGIGIASPIARLHVADSNVLFTGPVTIPGTTPYFPPASGAGSRMMWYPQKAAFRVGAVDGTQWDKDSIGQYSFSSGFKTKAVGYSSTSMGYSTIARGHFSTSMGSQTIADGIFSTSMGNFTYANGISSTSLGSNTYANGISSTSLGSNTQANGISSTSLGNNTQANGNYSTSLGNNTQANGNYSTSLGNNTQANGDQSTSMGNSTTASGVLSTSMGFTTFASGDISTCMGFRTKARSAYSLVIGSFNDTTNTNRLFEIGNGTDDNARKNALTVLSNGYIGVGTVNPVNQTEIIGAASATPVTLVIGNRGAFGPSAIEFISDYGLANQWRPGYIRSNDMGSFTGAMEFYTNGAGVLYGDVKGLEVRNGVTYTATGTVSSWSDTRLKKDVQPFTNGLDIINRINPVSFYYNQQSPFQTEKMQVGILAQELEKIAPYMVDKNITNDFEDLRSVNNQAYIFLLINAVKEQNKKMEEQQKQIDEQRKMIEELLKK
jgi:hypothetical protein